MKVSIYNKHSLEIECNDSQSLLLMQSVMDGYKVRRQDKIIIPFKAAFHLPTFKHLGINMSKECIDIVKKISENNAKRIVNIQKIKDQYVNHDIKFDYEYTGSYIPMDHQKIMFNAINYCDCSAIIADPGTCKTGPYLWAIDKRIKTGKIKKALVITLCDLKKNVTEEMSKQVPNLKGVAVESRDQFVKIIGKLYKQKEKNIDYDIFVSNYESMFSLCEHIPEGYFQMVVLDEAHRVGSPNSRQTKSIISKFESIPYKYIITGTLHANNIMSFFMPFRFLGADTVPYSNYYEFRRKYMYPVDPDQHIWVASSGAHEAVKNITGNLSVMFKKEDCLDLPELIRESYTCTMRGDQSKLYTQMKEDLVSTIDGMCEKCDKKGNCDKSCEDSVIAKTALVLSVKLHQIASGFYINTKYEISDTGSEKNISNTIILNDNPKMNLLKNTLNDIPNGRKVIIWSNYITSIIMISKELGKAFGEKSYITCYGNQDSYEQVKLWEKIDAPYMVANPRKMGVGQNIQYSNYQIFFNNSRSWIVRDQAEGRQHRQGQKNPVTIIDLLTENTIDEIALQALMAKQSLSLSLSELSRVLKNKGEMKNILRSKQ